MAVQFDPSIVQKMLVDLKQKDKRFKVFGAASHQYELNPPLAVSEIKAFESKHKVKLPEDYRMFITEIGNGGAGPYYGVFRFGEHDDGHDHRPWESGFLVGDLSAEFPHQKAWNVPKSFWDKRPDPGPETSEEEEDRLMEAWDQELEQHYWNPQNMNGAIPTCHLGCAERHWLVIHGPQRGFVWADRRADEAGIAPLKNGTKQVTFAHWYLAWLENPRDTNRFC